MHNSIKTLLENGFTITRGIKFFRTDWVSDISVHSYNGEYFTSFDLLNALTVDEAVDVFLSVVYHPNNLVFFTEYLKSEFPEAVDNIIRDPRKFHSLLKNFKQESPTSIHPKAARYVSMERSENLINSIEDFENFQILAGDVKYDCKEISSCEKGVFTAIGFDDEKVTDFTEADVVDFNDSTIFLKSDKLARITVETLIDDEGNREKFTVMSRFEVMLDDSRNSEMEFWDELDDFIQWGHSYSFKITNLISLKHICMSCVLLDTEDNREKAACSNKASVLFSGHDSSSFYDALDDDSDFIQWGETYKIEFIES